jgi:hypothetical protein
MSTQTRRWLVLGTVAVAVAVGIIVLRDTIGSRETPVDERLDLAVELRAAIIDEAPEAIEDMTHGLMGVCRLEIDADLVGAHRLDADEFRFVLSPTLNETDRRQLHGCLEDARVQHLQVDVLDMAEQPSTRQPK